MKENKLIGVFGGSFNPPHLGHTGLAREVLKERPELSEIWFMVAKQNPLKESYGVTFQDRFEMTGLACQSDPRLIPCDIEVGLETGYMSDTLRYLRSQYPGFRFALIIGMDNYNDFSRWKNWKEILENHPVYVYDRGMKMRDYTEDIRGKFTFLRYNIQEFPVSSTQIRSGESLEYLDPEVLGYIKSKELYPDLLKSL